MRRSSPGRWRTFCSDRRTREDAAPMPSIPGRRGHRDRAEEKRVPRRSGLVRRGRRPDRAESRRGLRRMANTRSGAIVMGIRDSDRAVVGAGLPARHAVQRGQGGDAAAASRQAVTPPRRILIIAGRTEPERPRSPPNSCRTRRSARSSSMPISSRRGSAPFARTWPRSGPAG